MRTTTIRVEVDVDGEEDGYAIVGSRVLFTPGPYAGGDEIIACFLLAARMTNVAAGDYAEKNGHTSCLPRILSYVDSLPLNARVGG
jgi:hypothetical protein